METLTIDDFVVSIPKANLAIIYVFKKKTEEKYPTDSETNIVLPLKESIDYVKSQNREICYDIPDGYPIIEKFLEDNGMLHD